MLIKISLDTIWLREGKIKDEKKTYGRTISEKKNRERKLSVCET